MKIFIVVLVTLLNILIMNPAHAAELLGRWELETIDNLSITPDLGVNSQFDPETISGFSSCNNYESSYHADNKVLTIESIQSTRKFCGGESYKTETAYFNALRQSSTYKIVGDQLYIFNSENIEILSFKRMPS